MIIDEVDIKNMSIDEFKRIKYLHTYLDEGWKIYKKNKSIIIKKNSNRILLSENVECHDKTFNSIINDNKPLLCIYVFLNNVLNSGWKIEKNNNNYIFLKNHGGEKKYFSDKYITTFMKEHLDNVVN